MNDDGNSDLDDDFPNLSPPSKRRSHQNHDGDDDADPPIDPPAVPDRDDGLPFEGEDFDQPNNDPPAPVAPPIQQEEPRRSGRNRTIPLQPGNAHGERRHPVNIDRQPRNRRIGSDAQRLSYKWSERIPGSSSNTKKSRVHDDVSLTEEELVAKLAQEGGSTVHQLLACKSSSR